MTEISKIMEYKKQREELTKNLYSHLREGIQKAKVTKQAVHRTIVRHQDNMPFVCHIHATALQALVTVYKLIPTETFFEVIAFDPKSRMYYLMPDHVFQRYEERLNIDTRNHLDILYHYVRNNPFIAFNYANPHELTGQGVTAWLDKGIIYGTKLAANILLFKTFIGHHTLTREQRRQTRDLGKKYVDATRVKIFRQK